MRKLTSILDTRYSILDTRYSILLLLLIILTFSNSIFARESEQSAYEKRCKVEYIQLDLITGTETIYKDTSQFKVLDYCEEGLERLSKKLDKWVDKKNTNIITKINEFKCKVKNGIPIFPWVTSYVWSRYRDCETNIQKLSAYLVDKSPNKIGANIYKEFNSIEAPVVD
jgi:hypothetical protein